MVAFFQTADSIKSASACKEEGNEFFKNKQYSDAVGAYTKAIKVCGPTIWNPEVQLLNFL